MAIDPEDIKDMEHDVEFELEQVAEHLRYLQGAWERLQEARKDV